MGEGRGRPPPFEEVPVSASLVVRSRGPAVDGDSRRSYEVGGREVGPLGAASGMTGVSLRDLAPGKNGNGNGLEQDLDRLGTGWDVDGEDGDSRVRLILGCGVRRERWVGREADRLGGAEDGIGGTEELDDHCLAAEGKSSGPVSVAHGD